MVSRVGFFAFLYCFIWFSSITLFTGCNVEWQFWEPSNSDGWQQRGQQNSSEECSDVLHLRGSGSTSGLQCQEVCAKDCLIQTSVRTQSSCHSEKKQGQHGSQQICPGDRQMPYCDLPHVESPYPSGHRGLLVNQVLVFMRAAACPFKRAGSNSHQQKRDHHTASGEGYTVVLNSLTWLQPFVLQSCFCMKRLPIAASAEFHTGGSMKGLPAWPGQSLRNGGGTQGAIQLGLGAKEPRGIGVGSS